MPGRAKKAQKRPGAKNGALQKKVVSSSNNIPQQQRRPPSSLDPILTNIANSLDVTFFTKTDAKANITDVDRNMFAWFDQFSPMERLRLMQIDDMEWIRNLRGMWATERHFKMDGVFLFLVKPPERKKGEKRKLYLTSLSQATTFRWRPWDAIKGNQNKTATGTSYGKRVMSCLSLHEDRTTTTPQLCLLLDLISLSKYDDIHDENEHIPSLQHKGCDLESCATVLEAMVKEARSQLYSTEIRDASAQQNLTAKQQESMSTEELAQLGMIGVLYACSLGTYVAIRVVNHLHKMYATWQANHNHNISILLSVKPSLDAPYCKWWQNDFSVTERANVILQVVRPAAPRRDDQSKFVPCPMYLIRLLAPSLPPQPTWTEEVREVMSILMLLLKNHEKSTCTCPTTQHPYTCWVDYLFCWPLKQHEACLGFTSRLLVPAIQDYQSDKIANALVKHEAEQARMRSIKLNEMKIRKAKAAEQTLLLNKLAAEKRAREMALQDEQRKLLELKQYKLARQESAEDKMRAHTQELNDFACNIVQRCIRDAIKHAKQSQRVKKQIGYAAVMHLLDVTFAAVRVKEAEATQYAQVQKCVGDIVDFIASKEEWRREMHDEKQPSTTGLTPGPTRAKRIMSWLDEDAAKGAVDLDVSLEVDMVRQASDPQNAWYHHSEETAVLNDNDSVDVRVPTPDQRHSRSNSMRDSLHGREGHVRGNSAGHMRANSNSQNKAVLDLNELKLLHDAQAGDDSHSDADSDSKSIDWAHGLPSNAFERIYSFVRGFRCTAFPYNLVCFTWNTEFARHYKTAFLRQRYMERILHRDIHEMTLSLDAMAKQRRPWQMAVINATRVAVTSIWSTARVEIYGSFATGLSVPSSDIDLVICDVKEYYEYILLKKKPKVSPLQRLAMALKTKSWVRTVTVIESTAFPVVKISAAFEEAGAEIRIDLTFDSPSHRGLSTCAFVKGLTVDYPALTPLTLILKQLLVMKGLSDPYSGGLSSYGLLLMLTSVLQRDRKRYGDNVDVDGHLGRLFNTFLETFGRQFNPNRHGISARNDRSEFVLAALKQASFPSDPLVIEDPFDASNNIGRTCFGVHQLKRCFQEALTVLEKTMHKLVPEEEPSFEAKLKAAQTALIPQSLLGPVFSTHHHDNVVSFASKIWLPPTKAGTPAEPVMEESTSGGKKKKSTWVFTPEWALDLAKLMKDKRPSLSGNGTPGDDGKLSMPTIGRELSLEELAQELELDDLPSLTSLMASSRFLSTSSQIVGMAEHLLGELVFPKDKTQRKKVDLCDNFLKEESHNDAVLKMRGFLLENNNNNSNEDNNNENIYQNYICIALLKKVMFVPSSLTYCLNVERDLTQYLPLFGKKLLHFSLQCTKVLLRSDRVVDQASSSARGLLNQLGKWVGCLTVGRDRALTVKALDLKSLLLVAYRDARLIAVLPFVTHLLSACTTSQVFRPPNPWLVGLLTIFAQLSSIKPGLRAGLRFEVELLCDSLKIDVVDMLHIATPAMKELLKQYTPSSVTSDFSSINLLEERKAHSRRQSLQDAKTRRVSQEAQSVLGQWGLLPQPMNSSVSTDLKSSAVNEQAEEIIPAVVSIDPVVPEQYTRTGAVAAATAPASTVSVAADGKTHPDMDLKTQEFSKAAMKLLTDMWTGKMNQMFCVVCNGRPTLTPMPGAGKFSHMKDCPLNALVFAYPHPYEARDNANV